MRTWRLWHLLIALDTLGLTKLRPICARYTSGEASLRFPEHLQQTSGSLARPLSLHLSADRGLLVRRSYASPRIKIPSCDCTGIPGYKGQWIFSQ